MVCTEQWNRNRQELWGQEGDSRLQSLLLSTYKVRRRVLKALNALFLFFYSTGTSKIFKQLLRLDMICFLIRIKILC